MGSNHYPFGWFFSCPNDLLNRPGWAFMLHIFFA
jgi:hypothetical protein